MKRALLTLIVFLVGVSAQAQQQPWAEKMFKDGTSHDFGTVPRGAQLYHRFKIVNIYAVPMQITNVQTSCGCTTATPSSKTLQSREEGYIEVKMDGTRFTGAKSIRINITVGPEYISTAELKVTANSRADIVFNPGQVTFGVVNSGDSPEQGIDVEYAGNLAWKVESVDTNGAPVTAKLEEWYRKPGQVGYRVKLKLNPDAPVGTIKHEVFLKTNDPASPLVPVLLEATVQASLTVAPDGLKFGVLKVGQAETRRVIVRSNGKPFSILSVEGAGDGISTTTPLPTKPLTVHVLEVRCDPEKAGDLKRQLMIKTDLQDKPIPLTVEAVGQP